MEEKFNYEKWYEKYHNEEIIDIKKYFSIEELNIIMNLNVKIKEKIYTKYEFELLNLDLLQYYNEEDLAKEDLEKTGVSEEEYNNLLEKIERIRHLYNF